MIPKRWLRFFRQLILRAVLAVPGGFCLSLEIFERHKFGQRYLTWVGIISSFFGVIMTLLVIDIFLILAKVDAPNFHARSDTIQSLWMFSFWIVSFWHKGVMLYRSFRGQQWYSKLPGEAHLIFSRLRLPEVLLFRFIEPLMALVFAYFIFLFSLDGLVATWLLISGTCLFFKRQVQYHSQRGVILDLIDSRARSERIRAALRPEEQAEKSNDFIVTSTTYEPKTQVKSEPDATIPKTGSLKPPEQQE